MALTDWQFSGLSSDFQIHQVIGLKQKRNRFYFKVQTRVPKKVLCLSKILKKNWLGSRGY